MYPIFGYEEGCHASIARLLIFHHDGDYKKHLTALHEQGCKVEVFDIKRRRKKDMAVLLNDGSFVFMILDADGHILYKENDHIDHSQVNRRLLDYVSQEFPSMLHFDIWSADDALKAEVDQRFRCESVLHDSKDEGELDIASKLGIKNFPALVYSPNRCPVRVWTKNLDLREVHKTLNSFFTDPDKAASIEDLLKEGDDDLYVISRKQNPHSRKSLYRPVLEIVRDEE